MAWTMGLLWRFLAAIGLLWWMASCAAGEVGLTALLRPWVD
jgi:hypothetical protein